MAGKQGKQLTIAVFGGSGATGRCVIAKATSRGMLVRGLVRQAGGLGCHESNVVEIPGSLLDPDAIEQTLKGADAAILLFGPRPPYKDIFCANATELIIRAMRKQKIARLVCQTGAMIGDYPKNRGLLFGIMSNFYQRKAPEMAQDRVRQETLVMESGLDWALLKPPRLADGQKSRKLQAGVNVKVGLLSSVSRHDLASFILDEIQKPEHPKQAVFIKGSFL